MSLLTFCLSIIVLLAVPGPTNTLLFLSGADVGFRRSLRLLIGESAGYLSVILPITTFAAPLFDTYPKASAAMKLVAAAWILWVALKLWSRAGGKAEANVVSIPAIFVTTLLNPKALIVALMIMPHGSIETVLPSAAIFIVLLVGIALVWISAGVVAAKASGRWDITIAISRSASVLLTVFSVLMARAAFGSL